MTWAEMGTGSLAHEQRDQTATERHLVACRISTLGSFPGLFELKYGMSLTCPVGFLLRDDQDRYMRDIMAGFEIPRKPAPRLL